MFWQSAYASTVGLPQSSTIAPTVDILYDFLVYLSVFFLILVTVVMVYFTVKYHRSKTGRETAYIVGSHTLETIWTVVPLVLMLFVFAWGLKGYREMRAPMKDPVEINIIGRQWLWNIEYTNGRKTLNELVLPKGKPVRLIMTSEDVLHSFFIPNFRIKQDVVPGRFTTLSFIATQPGVHIVFCAEYCGTAHSDMLAKAVVVEPEEFDEWTRTGKLPAHVNLNQIIGAVGAPTSVAAATGNGSSQPSQTPAERGKALAASKGCIACHSDNGTRMVGPSYKGIFGKKEEMADGTMVTVDENYIRKSLMDPNAQIVKGYTPSMPPFAGLLKDEEVNDLIAYIKSLK
ncbi:MAG TPA: cytochrome c oxidase subunit II [Oligoflexia bacterium]|nr:cytochrome c oxidase subunit II [Oligoflexia bacterium]